MRSMTEFMTERWHFEGLKNEELEAIMDGSH